MNADALRELIHARPFQPFVIHTADGRQLEVPHEDFIAMTRGGRIALVFGEGDHFDMLDVLLLPGVTVKGGAPSSLASED